MHHHGRDRSNACANTHAASYTDAATNTEGYGDQLNPEAAEFVPAQPPGCWTSPNGAEVKPYARATSGRRQDQETTASASVSAPWRTRGAHALCTRGVTVFLHVVDTYADQIANTYADTYAMQGQVVF